MDRTRADNAVELLFRAPVSTPESKGAPPPRYRGFVEAGMKIELDVPVMLRDGVTIYVDVTRPDNNEKVPPLIAWGPYGKHVVNNPKRYLPGAMNREHLSPHTRFEAPNPEFWVPNGYAVVNVNPRGTWYSEGNATFISDQEAEDYYDVIEWAGTQDWSNGKVGLSGVSYLALSQWRVAELNPPHLAAINPWEGWTDTYREVVRHGGIPDNHFWEFICGRWGSSINEVEDLAAETEAHPLFDEFWETKKAQLENVTTPAFVVASWSDQGLHTRGTLEGFKRINSSQKWLLVHGRKKWAHYYDPHNVELAKTFFDYFLKGAENGLEQWPPVRYEVRQDNGVGDLRTASSWPPVDTQYRTLYLDADAGQMAPRLPDESASVSYDSCGDPECSRAEFTYTFDEPTDVVGHMSLNAYVAAGAAYDMDLFVGIHKRDAHGNLVKFPYAAQFDDGPAAMGWLRVSHRELDEKESTPHQPVLAHRRVRKLAEGEIIEVHIEILPSGTRFEPGESIVLWIQGKEICPHIVMNQYRHTQTVNSGTHIVLAGGQYPSHLLIPVVPSQDKSSDRKIQ